jgi:hypothetical protein
MCQSKQSLNWRKTIHSSMFVQGTKWFVFIKIQLTNYRRMDAKYAGVKGERLGEQRLLLGRRGIHGVPNQFLGQLLGHHLRAVGREPPRKPGILVMSSAM